MNKCLYKYRSTDKGIEILENLGVWYSCPKVFEDKNDCHPPFKFTNKSINENEESILQLKRLLKSTKGSDKQLVEKYTPELINNIISKLENGGCAETILRNIFSGILQNDLRIFCLTETPVNNYMWEKYANNYKGIVIGFNINNKIFSTIHKVDYKSKDNWNINFNGTFYEYVIMTQNAKTEIFKMFSIKSDIFKDEQEFRSIHFTESEKYYYNNIHIKKENKKGSLFKIEKEDISCIYIGEKMSKENKEKVLKIVKTSFPHITVYEYPVNYKMKDDLNILYKPSQDN